MAEGIVTTDDTMFEEMLATSSPEIRSLARRARAHIYEVLPGTVEVVWLHQRSAGYGTGPRKLSEQFCWLAPLTRHLVFGYYYGTELPDPTGLLEGTGRLMRHVKVRTPQELHDPALRRLVQVATAHRDPPLPAPER